MHVFRVSNINSLNLGLRLLGGTRVPEGSLTAILPVCHYEIQKLSAKLGMTCQEMGGAYAVVLD